MWLSRLHMISAIKASPEPLGPPTGSKVVAADRLHYLGDLLPAMGAIVSLVAARAFGLMQVDALVGLGAAAMLAMGALRIFRGAWDALMDRSAPPEVLEGIRTLADLTLRVPRRRRW